MSTHDTRQATPAASTLSRRHWIERGGAVLGAAAAGGLLLEEPPRLQAGGDIPLYLQNLLTLVPLSGHEHYQYSAIYDPSNAPPYVSPGLPSIVSTHGYTVWQNIDWLLYYSGLYNTASFAPGYSLGQLNPVWHQFTANMGHFGMQKDFFQVIPPWQISGGLGIPLTCYIRTGADLHAAVSQALNTYYLGTLGALPLSASAAPSVRLPFTSSLAARVAAAQAHLEGNPAYHEAMGAAATGSALIAKYAAMCAAGASLASIGTSLFALIPGGAASVLPLMGSAWASVGAFGLLGALAALTLPQWIAIAGIALIAAGASLVFFYGWRIWTQINGQSPGAFDKGLKDTDPEYLLRISGRVPAIYPPTWGGLVPDVQSKISYK